MGEIMLIRIKYMDNRYDMIRPEFLDHLIKKGDVREFQRKDGWVVVGLHEIRHKRRPAYTGPERRMRRDQDRRRSMSA